MYLMYVDESGDTGIQNSPTDYFVLSGLVVHESQWRPFINRLLEFKRSMKRIYGLPVRSEIHAGPLLQQNKFGIPKHLRLAILRNFLDEIALINDISITNVVVDKRNKNSSQDVFDIAWRTLFQRFENTLTYGNFPGGHAGDFGMVISDATNGLGLQNIVRKMSVYNPVPNRGGNGFRNIPVHRIIEDPFEKDSEKSLQIQATDTCAFFLHRYISPNSFLKRQRATRYFERLSPVLNKHASSSNNLGIVYT